MNDNKLWSHAGPTVRLGIHFARNDNKLLSGGVEVSNTSARKPDSSVRCGRLSVSGWLDDERGWSFQLSRSYRDEQSETKYEQMRLFASDLPVLLMLLQKTWDSATPVELTTPTPMQSSL